MIFDVLFLAVFFATLVMLVWACLAALRGNRARSIAILRRLGIFAVVYICIVLFVSLASPQRVLDVGDDQCWDDWCLAVTDVKRMSATKGTKYRVTIRISSRARRVAQRGSTTYVYIMDELGRRFDPIPDPSATPFDSLLQPQEALITTREFELPADAQKPVLVASHGGSFPGLFIIGDSASLLHKRTVVRLD